MRRFPPSGGVGGSQIGFDKSASLNPANKPLTVEEPFSAEPAEQHALEPNIGAAYFWLSLVKGGRDLQTHALEDWMERGYAALQVMDPVARLGPAGPRRSFATY